MRRARVGTDTAVIGAALDLIPEAIRDRLRPDWLIGVDPVFAGLHGWTVAADSRSYRETAHVVYGEHQNLARPDCRTTIVMPRGLRVQEVVHELGHVLHEQVGFIAGVVPCTAYGARNSREAFAEAFTAWVMPGRRPKTLKGQKWSYGHAHEHLRAHDPKMLALFDALAGHERPL